MDKLEKGPKEIFSPEIQKVIIVNDSYYIKKCMTF